MKVAIESRVRVDARGTLVFQDSRLVPGEEVEIVIRPIARTSLSSFLAVAKRVQIDAPRDYSERFDDALKLSQ